MKRPLSIYETRPVFYNPVDPWPRIRHPEQEWNIEERLIPRTRAAAAPPVTSYMSPEAVAAQKQAMAERRRRLAKKNYGLAADLSGGLNEIVLIGALLLGGGFLYKKLFAKKEGV